MTDDRFELRFGSDGNRELVDASANGGARPVVEATLQLDSAQILQLGTSHLEIVAGVAASILVPILAVFHMRPGGTPYATTANLRVGWAAFSSLLSADVLDDTSPSLQFKPMVEDIEDPTDLIGSPLIVNCAVNPTAGDGTAEVTVYYTVLELT